jgi:phosphatidylglycerophosphate synthase
MVVAIAHADVRRIPPVLYTLGIGLVVAVAGAAALAGLETVDVSAVLAAPVVYVAGAALLLWRWRSGTGFGVANTVTLTRLIGTSWLVVLATAAAVAGLGRPGQIVVVAIGACCLLLDSVDGRLARDRGEASQFGARFDMEIDAAMLLVLSVGIAALGLAGWWVIGIGLMRYASAVASWLVPPLRTRVFYSFARKVVAAIQAIALLFALLVGVVPVIPHWVSTTVLAVALALLCWSFGRDIVWQLTTGREAGAPQWGIPTR